MLLCVLLNLRFNSNIFHFFDAVVILGFELWISRLLFSHNRHELLNPFSVLKIPRTPVEVSNDLSDWWLTLYLLRAFVLSHNWGLKQTLVVNTILLECIWWQELLRLENTAISLLHHIWLRFCIKKIVLRNHIIFSTLSQNWFDTRSIFSHWFSLLWNYNFLSIQNTSLSNDHFILVTMRFTNEQLTLSI